ncbi:ATP-binding cassette domain-containing protein, partial [Clostridium perfringens]
DSGEIKIFDKDIFEDAVYVKDNIGFVYDILNFYGHLIVKDFKRIVSNFYSKFDSELFDSYIERFEINNKSLIGNLSKGEVIKVMIANALSHDAKLLILDEPTAGLDPIIRKDILKLLQEVIE